MKLGLSLSRCLSDIFTGKVQETDVMVIVTRTDINPHNSDEWNKIWYGHTNSGYTVPNWSNFKNDYEDFRRMAIRLYDKGLIHQPRKFGAHPQRLPYHWLDLVVPVEDLEELPAVKQAWEHYQMVANLCS